MSLGLDCAKAVGLVVLAADIGLMLAVLAGGGLDKKGVEVFQVLGLGEVVETVRSDLVD